DLAGKLQGNAARCHHERGEGQAHAELLEFDRDIAVAVTADGYRKFAASQELGGFATDRGEVRLGQHMDQTDAFQGLQLALDIVLKVADAAGRRQRPKRV